LEHGSAQANGGNWKLMVSADNVHWQMAKLCQLCSLNMMKSAPHSLYSPNFTSSNCRLFDDIKGCLTGRSTENADERLEAVHAVPNGIESDFTGCLSRVDGTFEEMDRQQWRIQGVQLRPWHPGTGQWIDLILLECVSTKQNIHFR
jgi:hypothetical protein